MPPKILVCLTCPAITACDAPADFSSRTQAPSWPMEIQWKGARTFAAATSSSLNVSSFSPMTVTSCPSARAAGHDRSEEHTSELQSQSNLVCRLLLEKKNNTRSEA